MSKVTTKPFEVEARYLVIKYSDIDKYLNTRHQNELFDLADTIQTNRSAEGKNGIEGVFIDKRWEIYPQVLKLLEEMVNGS
jgi:hypothetical protein